MLQVKRHSLIVEYVVEKGCARVNELSQIFGVSPETIRRDLTALARNKKIVRSFGGAMISENNASFLAADTPTNHGNFVDKAGNDSNLLIVFYVQIMPDDFVMQLHRF